MDKVRALDTLVRRYCMEKSEELIKKRKSYIDLCNRVGIKTWGPGAGRLYNSKNPKILNLKNALIMIGHLDEIYSETLEKVEKLNIESCKSFSEFKKEILSIIEDYDYKSYVKRFNFKPDYLEEKAYVFIKNKKDFIEYINSITEEELSKVEYIPRKKWLSEEETNEIKEKVKKAFEVSGFCDTFTWLDREDMIVFKPSFLYSNKNERRLRKALKNVEKGDLYKIEFIRGHINYALDINLVKLFEYGGVESFVCCDSMKWLIYSSHEGSVAVVGEELVLEVKKIIKNWKRGLHH